MKKKKIWIIGCLLVALCLFFMPQISRIHADSGFDSNWGGGFSSGSSGGSNWGGSSSSGGSRNSESSAAVGYILVIGLAFCIIFVAAMVIQKIIGENTNSIEKNEIDFIPIAGNEFVLKAFDIYKKIQVAWMNFDTETLRKYTTDELYNMYLSQLDTLKVKNQQNIMRDFQLRGGSIKSTINDTNGIKTTTVKLIVRCKDYLIDQTTKQVLRGNKDATMEYHYELIFIEKENTKKQEDTCPNCGAPIKGNASSRCEYCNSVILKENYDLVLSKKRMISQRQL